jgi:hypothetical protein
MNKDDGQIPYEVGFRKPPRHTRFKPGQSGNPKGRTKGIKNLATIMREAMRETVIITENGERKTYNKLEVAVKQQINRAVAGDHKAMLLLLPLIQAQEALPEGGAIHEALAGEADRLVLASLGQRLRKQALAETTSLAPEITATEKDVSNECHQA